MLTNEINQFFAIALPLGLWLYGKIFDFQNTIALVANYDFRLYAVIVKDIHSTFIKILFNHTFLLVRK